MDIVTHAVTGACTGAVFNRPFTGLFAAIAPDVALWHGKRVYAPSRAYKALHGLLAAGLIGAVFVILFDEATGRTVLWAWISHIVLDVPTHGPTWSPRIFWPSEKFYFSCFKEWEWFNSSWNVGLTIAIIWSTLCLLLSMKL